MDNTKGLVTTLIIKNLLLRLLRMVKARAPEPLSILDLQGLGKDLWRDVDALEHVERERSSWEMSAL